MPEGNFCIRGPQMWQSQSFLKHILNEHFSCLNQLLTLNNDLIPSIQEYVVLIINTEFKFSFICRWLPPFVITTAYWTSITLLLFFIEIHGILGERIVFLKMGVNDSWTSYCTRIAIDIVITSIGTIRTHRWEISFHSWWWIISTEIDITRSANTTTFLL